MEKNTLNAKLNKLQNTVRQYAFTNVFYVALAFVVISLSVILVGAKKFEILPATFFSAITALFSYWAYKFSKEKFRLDLFDKRWEIYEKTLEFCSRVSNAGGLRANDDNRDSIIAAVQAAQGSFRGTGWHKTRALFGEEIQQLFEELNSTYAWLTSHAERPADPVQSAAWPDEMYRHSMFVWETVGRLPDIFKPYIYFGDYKRSQLNRLS